MIQCHRSPSLRVRRKLAGLSAFSACNPDSYEKDCLKATFAFGCGHHMRFSAPDAIPWRSCKFWLRSAVINRLRLASGCPVSVRELADSAYWDREDGGPDFAEQCIRISILELRREGWPIRTRHQRGYWMDWTHWEVSDYEHMTRKAA